jgi:biotin carboxyl carrier protein
MKQYRITLESHTFDVKVLDDPRLTQVRVEVDGETFTVGVEPVSLAISTSPVEEAPTAAPVAVTPASTGGQYTQAGGTVAAPLPGVIKSISVRPGQQVAADDELLVIEAMKMDNVIRAPGAGTIGTIHVTEGRQVAYGEPLLEITRD